MNKYLEKISSYEQQLAKGLKEKHLAKLRRGEFSPKDSVPEQYFEEVNDKYQRTFPPKP